MNCQYVSLTSCLGEELSSDQQYLALQVVTSSCTYTCSCTCTCHLLLHLQEVPEEQEQMSGLRVGGSLEEARRVSTIPPMSEQVPPHSSSPSFLP